MKNGIVVFEVDTFVANGIVVLKDAVLVDICLDFVIVAIDSPIYLTSNDVVSNRTADDLEVTKGIGFDVEERLRVSKRSMDVVKRKSNKILKIFNYIY